MNSCRLCGSRNKCAKSGSEKQVGQALANLSQAYTNFLLKDISCSSPSYAGR